MKYLAFLFILIPQISFASKMDKQDFEKFVSSSIRMPKTNLSNAFDPSELMKNRECSEKA